MSFLIAIKVAHTVIWVLFSGFIVALPVVAFKRRFRLAAILSLIILIECGILALNGGRCPLTDVAARYTTDRSPNFDIYLPRWLAQNNKTIFGSLFAVNEIVVLWRWRAFRTNPIHHGRPDKQVTSLCDSPH